LSSEVFHKGETIDIEKVKVDRDGILKASMKAFRSGVLPMLDIDKVDS